MLQTLIAETGFDRGKTPDGFLFVIMLTAALLVFIFAGGMYMRNQEVRARQAREDAKKSPGSSP